MDRLAFVPHGGTSFLSRTAGGGDVLGCKPSPKVTSFVSFIMDALPEVKAIKPTMDAVFVVRGTKTSFRKTNHQGYSALLQRVKGKKKVRVVDFAEAGDIIEQMKIVRSAKALVGVHGAGLTHALWMHQGSRVLELTQEFRCHCYQAISNFVGHEWEGISKDRIMPRDFATMVLKKLGME